MSRTVSNGQIRLLFAGDFIPPEAENNIFSEDLISVLKDKDFSIVNLETPLTESDEAIDKTGLNFKRSFRTIQHIKNGFFDAVALSNNHIRDFGSKGVVDTLDICHSNQIKTVGAGNNLEEAAKPLRTTLKGEKISILNYSEREFNIASDSRAGANPYDSITAFYDIQREKQEYDYVIVIYHGGLEYHYYPTIDMVKKFKYMADIGADAVVSHHTHRYSGYIKYNNKPLLFGLGNLLSDTDSKNLEGWFDGLIAKLVLNEKKIDVELIPTTIHKGFEFVDLANNNQKILNHIDEISENIQKPGFLENYWDTAFNKDAKRITALLKSSNQNHYRLLKYVPFFNRGPLKPYKAKLLLNHLRCDSHREKLIKILDKPE